MKTILVTGSNGSLGSKLVEKLESIEKGDNQIRLVHVSEDLLDLTSQSNVKHFFKVQPHIFDCIINCAAMTDVDACENEPEKALMANAYIVKNLLDEAYEMRTPIIHISTDYVFNGDLTNTKSYTEEDDPNPINEYGRSKLAGEKVIMDKLEEDANYNAYIFRTSWLYDEDRPKGFVKWLSDCIMLHKRNMLIVKDERSTPISVDMLSDFIINSIPKVCSGEMNRGIYHAGGPISFNRIEFAEHLISKMLDCPFSKLDINLVPITSKELDRPALRPKNSSLDSSKLYHELDVHFFGREYIKKKTLDIMNTLW